MEAHLLSKSGDGMDEAVAEKRPGMNPEMLEGKDAGWPFIDEKKPGRSEIAFLLMTLFPPPKNSKSKSGILALDKGSSCLLEGKVGWDSSCLDLQGPSASRKRRILRLHMNS